jgi:hypothetical protein
MNIDLTVDFMNFGSGPKNGLDWVSQQLTVIFEETLWWLSKKYFIQFQLQKMVCKFD